MQQQVYNYYNNGILKLESELKRIRNTISYLYLIRLITFLSFIAFFILFFQLKYNILFAILTTTSLLLFLFVVKYDLTLVLKEKFLASKLLINRNELNSLDYHYHERETGEQYTDLNPHLAADFDLFGSGSLFQYLNRTSTKMGERRFAESLCQSQHDKQVILKKQQAIKELAEKGDFIQNFQAYGMLISENGSELSNLQSWLNEYAEKLQLLRVLAVIIPLLNAAWIVFVALGILSLNSILLPLLLSLFIIRLNNRRINNAHSKLGKTARVFEKYTSQIKMIENEEFKSSYLCDLKQQLSIKDCKASQSLASLLRLLNNFDIRYNVVVSVVLNSLALFDIQVFCRLAKWKENHKNSVSSWFTALSELDAMISYATFAYNNQAYVSFPQIADKDFSFQATEMGHPLLPPTVRITNSALFEGTPSVIIITGANMAGKSTFLRTISVNLILAMNGAPVCAERFIFTPCDILSSIKIQDSLSNNESYFYAELLRLKDIIDHIKVQPKTLVVLDEILRGTNTKDKQFGSLGLLEKLISLNSIVIIATHDLVIGELENKYPHNVTNHCFEVELSNDQLIFDYKLKKGVSKKLNASFLMKKMEIIG